MARTKTAARRRRTPARAPAKRRRSLISDRLRTYIGRNRQAFHNSLISVVIVALATVAVHTVHEYKYPTTLPLDISIGRADLSDMPVLVGPVTGCGCWTGPRRQAEKKYNFSILNRWTQKLNIADDTESAVRLIVAYPAAFTPTMTLPVSDHAKLLRVPNPPDTPVWKATGQRTVTPSRIDDGKALFGTPDGYTVWALPATPNRVVESFGSGSDVTYATMVDKQILPPGEMYSSDKTGHQDWVFYVPLEYDWAAMFPDAEFEIVPEPAEVVKHVVVVGIGVFAPDGELIGFAPSPPESAVVDPSAF